MTRTTDSKRMHLGFPEVLDKYVESGDLSTGRLCFSMGRFGKTLGGTEQPSTQFPLCETFTFCWKSATRARCSTLPLESDRFRSVDGKCGSARSITVLAPETSGKSQHIAYVFFQSTTTTLGSYQTKWS